MSAPAHTGRCLCRAVTFAFDGPPRWVAHCHCESCRRQCSAGFTTFIGVADGLWRWSGGSPALYRSSPGVERYFCATCGSPMAYRHDSLPDEMHFYLASLDDPAALAPQRHDFAEERLPWIHQHDGLPGYEGTTA